jgi:hypothetical protein
LADHSQAWLETQLLRQMAQVKAPDTLWAQIERGRESSWRTHSCVPRRDSSRRLYAVFATLILLATGDLAWEVGKAHSAVRLTDTELASITNGTSRRIDSTDPAAIRAWVKARTNRDIELNCGGAANIQLSGARLIDFRNKLVAAISYKLDGNEGLMFVADKGITFQRVSGDRLISWNSPNQSFTLTFPPARGIDPSCVACHVDGRRQL